MVVVAYNRPLLVANRVRELGLRKGVVDIAVQPGVVNNMLGDNLKLQQHLDYNNRLLV